MTARREIPKLHLKIFNNWQLLTNTNLIGTNQIERLKSFFCCHSVPLKIKFPPSSTGRQPLKGKSLNFMLHEGSVSGATIEIAIYLTKEINEKKQFQTWRDSNPRSLDHVVRAAVYGQKEKMITFEF